MSSQHPIDDLFRKELENREPGFREEYWKKAEKVLDQHLQTSSGSSWWNWFGAIIIVAAVAGLIGYYFGTDHSTSTTVKKEVVSKENKSASAVQNNSSHNRIEVSATDRGVTTVDTISATSNQQLLFADSAKSNLNNQFDKRSSSAAATNVLSGKTSSLKKNVASESMKQANVSAKSGKEIKTQTESKKNLKQSQNNFAGTENKTPNEENASASAAASTQSKETSGKATETKGDFSLQQTIEGEPFMEPLSFQQLHLTFDSPNPSSVSLTPSLKSPHHSPLKSLELSLTGAPTLITVPSNKSTAWGYEWNGLLQYRVNNFVAGVGTGQFFVKDHISFAHDSITESTSNIPFITHDSLLVIDSMLVQDSNSVYWVYDTTLHVTSDTTYIVVTTHDTVSVKKNYTSSGHYLELPVIFSYRFYGLGLRWQITAGASYGWYSGGLRYAVNSEGQLISYKPGPVISILGRLYAQYPLSRKFYLQGYAGARYVIGLKSAYPTSNYLIYSLGLGILYQF